MGQAAPDADGVLWWMAVVLIVALAGAAVFVLLDPLPDRDSTATAGAVDVVDPDQPSAPVRGAAPLIIEIDPERDSSAQRWRVTGTKAVVVDPVAAASVRAARDLSPGIDALYRSDPNGTIRELEDLSERACRAVRAQGSVDAVVEGFELLYEVGEGSELVEVTQELMPTAEHVALFVSEVAIPWRCPELADAGD